MKPRTLDIVAVVSLGATLWLSVVFGRVLLETWRQPDLRFGLIGVGAVALLVWGLCLTSLLWCRWQWRDYRWQLAERRGRCGRCRAELRAARDVCPSCGYPLPATATHDFDR